MSKQRAKNSGAPSCVVHDGSAQRGTSGVAVIGMGMMAPGAADPDTFLWNYLQKNVAIKEIPEDYWDWRLFYSENRRDRDKSYSKWGGFTDVFPFDPIPEGIAPASMRALSCAHIMAWEAARRALSDAGYENAEGLDRLNTSVILAMVAGFTTLNMDLNFRTHLPYIIDSFDPSVLERLPKWQTDSIVGFLGSLITGRLANRYDFGGENYILDSACASTLKTIELAVRDLESGRCNAALVGGVDANQCPAGHMVFARSQALSPTGEVRPFDKDADGIVLSDGCAIFLLKRLADAQAAGDKIYAVIRGTGGSSDGHGASLTTPQKQGQLRALEKAYAQAGFSVSTLDFLEAHGTGTSVGDRVELDSVNDYLVGHGAEPKSCQIASVKALVGHAKAVAGAYGMVSALTAMYHRVLPPQANLRNPIDGLRDPDGRVFVRNQAVPWLRHPDHPRRCAVNAFGFGGTNVHVVLEEDPEGRGSAAAPGGRIWPAELFVWRASDRLALISSLQQARMRATRDPKRVILRDFACTCAHEAAATGGMAVSAAIVAGSVQDLDQALDVLIRYLDGTFTGKLPPYIHVRECAEGAVHPRGKVAFLFPGQGSQYPGMAAESSVYLEPLRASLTLADSQLLGSYGGELLSRFLFPESAFSSEEEALQRARLADTHVAQPAIGAVSCGFLDLLVGLGVRPEMCAGHSYGEYVALHAAGVISREALLALSELRGRLMGAGQDGVGGAMAAVRAGRDEVTRLLKDHPSLVIANHNAPTQVVVSGAASEVDALVTALQDAGIGVKRLPVSGAFHSSLMETAQKPLAAAIEALVFGDAEVPFYSNVSGALADGGAMKRLLPRHLLSPVEFVSQVESMYVDGARIFVEVGPSQVLSGLVRQILGEREHTVVSLDPVHGGLKGMLCGLGALFVEGVLPGVVSLFADRGATMIDWAEWQKPVEYPATTWWVDGRTIRPHQESVMKKVETSPATRGVEKSSAGLGVALPDPSAGFGAMPPEALLQAYKQYQETMQAFLRLQEQVLQQLVTGGSGERAGAAISSVGAVLPASTAREASVPERVAPVQEASVKDTPGDSIQELVIRSVSERTGYPPDMLDQDLNMEADLGIDSIKRLEILSALVNSFPQGANMEADMDRLTRARTLREVIAELERVFSLSVGNDPSVVADGANAPAAQEEAPVRPVGRYMTRGVVRDLVGGSSLRKGHYLVVADGADGLPGLLVRSLEKNGCSATLLPASVSGQELPAVVEAVKAKGAILGLICLGGAVAAGMPSTLEEWRGLEASHVFGLFLYLQALGSDLAAQRGMVLAISRMGGAYGRDGAAGVSSPLAGAAAGLLKTLALEVPGIAVRTVDFGCQGDEQVSQCIMDELGLMAGDDEIGYSGSGQRLAYVLDAADRDASGGSDTLFLPSSDWVLLAIGGGRGITAEAIMPLVVKGMRVILVGRHAYEEDEPVAWRPAADESALRSILVEDMKRSGSKVTPAQIEEQLRVIMRNRSIRATIERLSGLGAVVEYHAVDMTNEQDAVQLLDRVYAKHGRIDMVVQGAGVIEDKLLQEKDVSSFERVFRAKVDSTYLLRRHLRFDTLKAFVLFGSVAGRTGNRGQCDYAAANETLNRMGFEMANAWPGLRVVCFNWGPWASTGMVSESLKRQFEARGVYPIPPEAGSVFLFEELKANLKDIEVIAGIFDPSRG